MCPCLLRCSYNPATEANVPPGNPPQLRGLPHNHHRSGPGDQSNVSVRTMRQRLRKDTMTA